MQVHVVMYSSLQNSIAMCAYGEEVGIPYNDAKRLMPDIFSVDDIFQLNYEQERGLYCIVRAGEKEDIENGPNLPEIIWIKENFDRLFQHCKLFTDNFNKDTINQRRIHLLFASDWYMQRHSEETTLGIQNTLTQDQYDSLLVYRQWLRDLSKNVEDMNVPFDTISWMELPV